MIKCNGYYCKIYPSYYEDFHGGGNKTTYIIFDAYWFNDNGKVYTSSKKNKFLFSKSDFKKTTYFGEYDIKKDIIIATFGENTIHENKRTFKVTSANLVEAEGDFIYLFIPWESSIISRINEKRISL